MEFYNREFELTSLKCLKNKYFKQQLTTKHKPIVNIDMLKKIEAKYTFFNNEIKLGDYLLIGMIINNYVPNKNIQYTFFYTTKKELSIFEKEKYYVSDEESGIPRFITDDSLKIYNKNKRYIKNDK